MKFFQLKKIFFILLLQPPLFASNYAIIGGYENTIPAYAALVSPDGTATKISGQTPEGEGWILSVSMNESGTSIISGYENGGFPYAALVSPGGIATKISGQTAQGMGDIQDVAINKSGISIIGGYENGNVPYAALVSPDGIATKISGQTPQGVGEIVDVAINKSGISIIGGYENGNSSYAAFVSPSGVATKISGQTPQGVGIIYHVGINRSGTSIMGGYENGGLPYAAFVSPGGIATKISGQTPQGAGQIWSVSINKSGASVIGGYENGSFPYVAFVSSSGVAKRVTGDLLQGEGIIQGVSINDSGAALIGGGLNDGSQIYVALVSPEGVAKRVISPFSGEIGSVAINEAGAGIVGGWNDDLGGAGYAALISPSGIPTEITGEIPLPFTDGVISWVDILNTVVPDSWGPGNAYPNVLFALSTQVLLSHQRMSLDWKTHHTSATKNEDSNKFVGLLAEVSEDIRGNIPCHEGAKYAVWVAPFGLYAHEDKEDGFPALTHWAGGSMIGFDYLDLPNAVIGVAGAYAFNRVNSSGNLGHAIFHQEFLTLYGSWGRENLIIDASLWGGFYQMHNKRITLGIIRSKADVQGWMFSSHFGLSTPFYAIHDWFTIEPFFMFDWVNNWQGKIREQGHSGFNLRIGDRYTNMLRSEVGINFYEFIHYRWGDLVFVEKGSYVNKKPFHTGDSTAFFVGSASTFGIEVYSDKMQNLGAVQFSTQFNPCKNRYPFGSITYQGEFGSSFQSHVISFEIGKRF